MANEFKKGSYNISLPDVTKDSTLLACEDGVSVSTLFSSYQYRNITLPLNVIGVTEILSPDATIDLSGKTEFECQIRLMGQITPLFANPIYLNFMSNIKASSSLWTNFLHLTVQKYNNIAQGQIFLNLRMFRASATSKTWTFMCYANVAQRGSDSMKGTVTSNPSTATGTFLYPLSFYSGTVVLATDILGISYSIVGSGGSSTPLIYLNYHTY